MISRYRRVLQVCRKINSRDGWSSSIVQSGTRASGLRGGLPIARLRRLETIVHAHLAESISIEILAELAELSPLRFCRVLKQAQELHRFTS
jgi:hypothetical protein